MGGRKAFNVGLQVLLLIIWIAPGFCQDGFLSIDCGSDVEYVDNTTGIRWETDDKYISTGKNAQGIAVPNRSVRHGNWGLLRNFKDSSLIVSMPVCTPGDSALQVVRACFCTLYINVLNRKQVETLRYFDEERGKDCYVLPVKPQYTYLLRPTFFYGNWQKAGPSNFRVYLNATFWMSIAFGSGAAQDFPAAYEALVYSTGTQLNFCMVKITGIAFIASLELRLLSRGMYSTVVGTNTFLSLYDRQNSGVFQLGSYVRYPEDVYDRIWYAGGSYESASFITRTNISSSNTLAPNQPPPKVMEDAWIYYGPNRAIFVYYQDFGSLEGPVRDLKFQVYGYFQELDGNASASNVRGMEYIFNDEFVSAFNTSDQPLQQDSTLLLTYKRFINVTLLQASWSQLNAMVNAFEFYYIYDFNTSATAVKDVNAVTGLQRSFNLTDWTGDPCFPVPYEWLSCNFNTRTPSSARVTQLFLANMSRRMSETIGPILLEIKNLTALTYLNLSSNRLATLPANLKELNLSVLDFSNNNLSGSISNFLEAINLGALREIHAADNRLEGEFQIDSLVQLKHLKIGNFDRNLNINGLLDLSGWHASLLTSVHSSSLSELQLFSLVDNNITDIYPKLGDLEPAIEAVLSLGNRIALNNGILLGGNPYCKRAKHISLAQRYLCRSSVDSNNVTLLETSSRKLSQKTLAIALGTSVGAFIMVVSCICFPISWKLRKQTYALLEMQEALEKQQVQPPFYSYAELRVATRDFSSHNKLGEGGFGTVYKAVGVDGTILAVKKLKLTKQVMTEFLNEVVMITGIKHRNLVQLKGCCIQGKQRILVYEYAENGNLAEALWEQQGIKLDWPKRFNICVGVARGLLYLHEELQPRIIHRDIKPANILLDKNFNAKIADFGLARHFLDDQSHANFSHRAGTLGYFAPEYAAQGQLTEKADVFSFGVLLLEIVSGRKCIDHSLPFEKTFLLNVARDLHNEGRLLDLLESAIRESTSSDIDGEVTRVINIALLCSQMEPTRRPSMSHVVTMLQGSMDVTVLSDIPVGSIAMYNNFMVEAPHGFKLYSPETCSEPYASESVNIDETLRHSSSTHRGGGSLELMELSGR